MPGGRRGATSRPPAAPAAMRKHPGPKGGKRAAPRQQTLPRPISDLRLQAEPSIPKRHPLADKLRLVIGSFENDHRDVARFINEDFGVAIENLPLPAHALQGLKGCELHTIMGGISKDAVDGDDELWSAMMAFSHNVRTRQAMVFVWDKEQPDGGALVGYTLTKLEEAWVDADGRQHGVRR